MRKIAIAAILATLMLALSLPGLAQDVVELRMTWYTDGNEDEVMRDLLDRFEMENSDIRVVMDNVPYQAGILQALPVQLAAGEGPDMARVTNLGGLAEFYLDLTPYLSDPDYWVESFGVGLGWSQLPGQNNISALPTQLTITGPFINRTLFEQAGVAVPSDMSDQVTWEEWAAAANEVADILEIPFPMAMDRSGHRFAGPAISMGAKYFDDEGHPLVAGDEGFRAMAELFVNWHNEGTMPLEIWAANTGYAGANEEFGNSQVVFYMSGSWQIGQFSNQIGDAFDWAAVPNPCGPGGCTGLPGGAWVAAIGDTGHPAEVARVMEYLASEEIQEEFYARTLFIPGHQALLNRAVDFNTDLPQALSAIDAFIASANALEQTAYDIQGYAFNFIVFNASRDRLTQAIVGELTLDEAIERIQEDVDEQLAEQMGG
ncbi:MAG: ABC transporter substrate-binding protein [Anaerolineaceae bacterium]|nr:ABC transporter substrate-binding protein [Anaerolineaceae bacterium]